jgi:hypothetical protein
MLIMKQYFQSNLNPNSLSLIDLLEARDAFHVHLYNKENVIATAIGKFRIRKKDPDSNNPAIIRDNSDSPPRTLETSIVRSWSWPCILVFVDKWLSRMEMKEKPEHVVPGFVYMPDGRAVPLCVIFAPKKKNVHTKLDDLVFTPHLMGGGYPVISDVQGQERIGTIGCLVTDGHSVYALTNKHVTGEVNLSCNDNQGNEIYTLINGQSCKIGYGYPKQLGKELFVDIYKGWPGKNVYSNIDAGLVKLENVTDFTAQIFGIGEMDEIIDLNPYNISVDLIGCPVRAFGGASGHMRGEIQALFYRYKSIGGFDYISDLVIGKMIKDDVDFVTQPGDSGTIWFYDPSLTYLQETEDDENIKNKDYDENNNSIYLNENMAEKNDSIIKNLKKEKIHLNKNISNTISQSIKENPTAKLRPIALQWGGQVLMAGDQENRHNFALASCLSIICRELDIEIVRNWNTGYSEYWGEVGHYKVGSKAIDLLSNKKLLKLMKANSDAISFDDESLTKGTYHINGSNVFVPLSDVADLVWKYKRGPLGENEKPNHFADIDQEGTGTFSNKTLLNAFEEDKNNLKIAIWNDFYDSINVDSKNRGSLPFRIWQIYNEMVKFLKNKDVEKFLCAAGILSHYVGDACQPLHTSKYHAGLPESPSKVHSDYETTMLNKFTVEFVNGVNKKLTGTKVNPKFTGGKNSAIFIMQKMKEAMENLPPLEIIKVYDESKGSQKYNKMFLGLGDKTIDCLCEGASSLAEIWESAWKEGDGDLIEESKLSLINKEILKNIYEDVKFLQSFQLTDENYDKALA